MTVFGGASLVHDSAQRGGNISACFVHGEHLIATIRENLAAHMPGVHSKQMSNARSVGGDTWRAGSGCKVGRYAKR